MTWSRWRAGLVNIAAVSLLLVAVSFLPPDTSLRDVQRSGVLKVCVPPTFPPLVTGNATDPGFDVELVQHIADSLGLRLALNPLAAMGSDFNPRNWLLTRAQCDMIAGGLADTLQNRGFLQMLPTGVETGWVVVSRGGTLPAAGATVAVLPATSGFARVALSSWLRGRGWQVQRAANPAALLESVADDQASIGITERFLISTGDAAERGLSVAWLTEEGFARNQMALGLWKGDQTLWRAVNGVVDAMKADGSLEALRHRYGLSGGLDDAPEP
ncbi:hypothetical protein VW29_16490 [Devosia limi DSM 17137]|uniref:Polar amino acid transport system substrate-binding protein n=1 Tax=Devosia limi DSM 17137 TaxID=1121477 RepID=A0A0F5LEJ3_9HYPH|nr:transporter substrate-binding domain-containing protein [Devosia limi]KKB80609.1 hypothetical protein VW29_16490 [Devosia limi DSM 17137]SHE51165.1 polar amino acid transport system substrate-binding protein [Devosia limi DSM 17137]